MLRIASFATALLLIAVALPAQADHTCDENRTMDHDDPYGGPCPCAQYDEGIEAGPGTSVRTDDDHTLITIADALYVEMEPPLEGGYVFSVWVYAESNGMDGLQRPSSHCTGDPQPHDLPVF